MSLPNGVFESFKVCYPNRWDKKISLKQKSGISVSKNLCTVGIVRTEIVSEELQSKQ